MAVRRLKPQSQLKGSLVELGVSFAEFCPFVHWCMVALGPERNWKECWKVVAESKEVAGLGWESEEGVEQWQEERASYV